MPFFGVSTLRPALFCDPLPSPIQTGNPPVGPLSVLYIYNEIQIHISRTVSTPRVTVWILLTLISWIMLIFTLSAHRQQTPHDMLLVTAVSVWRRVSACAYVSSAGSVCWSDCHVVKLICMWKGRLITSLMQMRNAHMHTRTHTPMTAYYRGQKIQCEPSF